MPKLSLELKDFSAGIMSNADASDIPEGAAVDSLNINPMGKMGAATSILGNEEIMASVPPITSMVVRDDLDGQGNNLAVNIGSNFIYIPNYQTDSELTNFIDIVELGQLIHSLDGEDDVPTATYAASPLSEFLTDGDGLGKWNYVLHAGYPHMYTVVPTKPGYIYAFSTFIGTSIAAGVSHSTVSTPRVLMLPYNEARTTFNDSAIITADAYSGTDLNTTFIAGNGDDISAFSYLVDNSKEVYFNATTEHTVIIVRGATAASYTTTVSEWRCQFSKGGYLWAPLGDELDLTDTDKGLFIGSDTSEPHLLNRMKDDEDVVLSFIEKSECKPSIGATSMTNIDFMALIPAMEATDEEVHLVISGIYSEPYLWAMANNWSNPGNTPGVNYTNFFKSEQIPFLAKGVGGITPIASADSDSREFYIWGFEDWNFYKAALPEDVTSVLDGSPAVKIAQTNAWDIELKMSWSLAGDVVPDGGYITKIVESVNRPGFIYCLFSKEGGFKVGDAVVLELDVGNYTGLLEEGAGARKIYNILDYQNITAYSSHKYNENWLGVRNDVNPKGGSDWFWPKISAADAKPPKYKDGGYAELVYHDTISSIDNACWINIKKKAIALDVAEQSLTCSTIYDDTTAEDLVSFSIEPLGKTAFLRKTGKWRKAEQFPNNWPNGDTGDGWWTDIVTNQTKETTDMMVFIKPEGSPGVTMGQTLSGTDVNVKINEMYQAYQDCLSNSTTQKYTAISQLPTFNEVYEYHPQTYPDEAYDNHPWVDYYWTSHNEHYAGDSNTILRIKKSAVAMSNLHLMDSVKAIMKKIEDAEGDEEVINACNANVPDWTKDAYEGSYFAVDEFYGAGYNTLLLSWFYIHIFGERGAVAPSGFAKHPGWGDEHANNSEFYNDMELALKLWTAILEVALIDADKVVQVYSNYANHIKIGNDFPFSGYYDTMEAYADGTDQFITCGKLVQGKLKFTTMKLIPGTGTSSLDRLNGLTLEFDDVIADNSFDTTGNNSYTIEEFVYESTQDNNMNIVRVKTEIEAPLSEYTMIPILESANVPFYQTDSYGSQSNANLATANNRAMVVASYTGDLIVRAYTHGAAPQNHPNGVADAAGAVEQVKWTYSPLDSGDASIGISVEDGKAATENVPDITPAELYTAPFELNDTIIYNMSYLYDGYQEGPLMPSPVTHIVAADYGCEELNITVNTTTNNPRITAVNVYRKKRHADKYKLVKQVEIDSSWNVTASAGVTDANISSTAFMQSGISTTIIDDGGAGVSYEALTGMPETLYNTIIQYAESEQVGSYLFVTDGRHEDVDNSEKYIFRSQAGRFSLFNWSMDYVGLPEVAHTLKACYNRLFAFSNKAMYQIDPHTLALEAQFEGFGISDQKSVAVIDGVLYISNKNGVYAYAGGKFKVLTSSIQDLWDAVYSTYTSTVPILANDKKYNTLLVIFSKPGVFSGDDVPDYGFSYSLDKKRWDRWTLPKDIKSIATSGDNTLLVCGESPLVAGYTDEGFPLDAAGVTAYEADITDYEEVKFPYSLYELHEGADNLPLTWKTKELTMQQDSRDKKFKKVKIIGSGVYISKITIDDTETEYDQDSATAEANGNCEAITINTIGKKMQIEVSTVFTDVVDETSGVTTATASNPYLQNLSIIYNLRTIK